MKLFEHKLAIVSLVLGVLAMGTVVLFGPLIACSYLGIPAIVIGAILLSRIRSHSSAGWLPAIFEAILGIIFRILQLDFALLTT
jgi:hypothetical protein